MFASFFTTTALLTFRAESPGRAMANFVVGGGWALTFAPIATPLSLEQVK